MVRDPGERHHGVERDENPREEEVQSRVDVLAHHEDATVDVRPHLKVVVHGEVADGVGVEPPRLGVLGRRGRQVVRVGLHQRVEDEAVLETRVQPLPEERDDRVGGISEEEGASRHEVWVAAEGDERAGRVGEVVLQKAIDADQVHRVGEVPHEEGQEVLVGLDAAEDVEGHEEGEGERLVLVGKGDHHELVPGPDVEVVRGHGEVARCRRRHGEFLVAVVDVLLAVVQPSPPHHLSPHGGVGSVAAEDEVGADDDLLCVFPHLKVKRLLVQVRPREAVLEVQLRYLLRLRQQLFVQPPPVSRVYSLALRPVRLGREFPALRVDQAGVHGDGGSEGGLFHPHRPEGFSPAHAHRQVDAPPRDALLLPNVRAGVVDVDVIALAGEEEGVERSYRSAANDSNSRVRSSVSHSRQLLTGPIVTITYQTPFIRFLVSRNGEVR